MSNYSSKDVQIVLIGGYDLRPYTNDLGPLHREAIFDDVTVFGVTDELWAYTGLRRASYQHKGFYDDAAAASNAALAANFGITVVGMVGVAGNVFGRNLTLFKGLLGGTWDRPTKIGGLTYANASYHTSGEVDEGVVLQPYGNVTTNSNSSSLDGTAPSSFGAVAMLQVPALTLDTATGFVVKIQDSADNASFADVAGGAFTAVTTAPKSQRLVIAGTVRRYVRALWTWTGGAGAGSTAAVCVGFFRGSTVQPTVAPPQDHFSALPTNPQHSPAYTSAPVPVPARSKDKEPALAGAGAGG